MSELTIIKQPTMSSLEIAELTGKRHQDVIRDIRNVLEQAEIEAAQFCAPCKLPSGQTSQVYNLPRCECDLVVSGYSVKYRLAIIDRWHELESKQAPFQVPQTLSERPDSLMTLTPLFPKPAICRF